VLERVNCNC